jgi:tetratricopeptide (TPR) repeat protein
MAIKSEKELSENARGLWLKAVAAVELHNYGYAISLLQAVLKETPEFLEGRKVLRSAEIAATKGKKSFFSGFSGVSLKGSGLVKKDPLAAMEAAEKSLESDPYGAAGNNLLKDAANAAGMPEIAAFALETLAAGNPKDTKVLHQLGEHYFSQGDGEKAVEVFNRIVEINPSDLIAIKRGKDAAAVSTIKTGGWETAKDYRDLIKDKETAVSLEQQSRVVRSEEMIERQLRELHERAEAESNNLDVARRIAGLYEDKKDLENALAWYEWANELAKRTDPMLDRKASEMRLKMLNQAMETREEYLRAIGPDHEYAAQYRQELEDLKAQRAETLLAEARRRVERNPTDLQLRYELGEQLMAAKHFTEAIPELQKARNNPNVRLKAMHMLGRCYREKAMLDLAAKQFADAAHEMPIMDALKKDVVYDLGLVYEAMGDKSKSLECMKQIYDVDYGYKDVAERVEKSYGEQG